MNFLEAFEELSILTEESDGGQKTYKQFLIGLLKYLGGNDYSDKLDWFLHHKDGDHGNNERFETLVLMEPFSHRVLHGTIKNKKAADYQARVAAELNTPTNKRGYKYVYIPIGQEIKTLLDKLLSTPVDQKHLDN